MRRAAKHAGKYILLLIMLVCFGHILAMGTEIGGYERGLFPVNCAGHAKKR